MEKIKDVTIGIDTSKINHLAVMERYTTALVRQDANTHGGVYKRACHFKATCSGCGDDRLQLYPNRPQYNPTLSRDDNNAIDAGPCFWCSICGQSGTILHFIALSEGLEWNTHTDRLQILAIAGLEPAQVQRLDGQSLRFRVKIDTMATDNNKPPCDAWQKRAISLTGEAVDFLWSDSETSRRALAYLRKRGLTDETIKQARLGYIAEQRFELRSEWGLKPTEDGKEKLFIPRGWLIPWVIDKNLWRIDIRRHPHDIKEAGKRIGKYHRLSGSSNGLYGVNIIKADLPLFVVESPIDAITGRQETSYMFVATGSTNGARNDPRWCEAMAAANPVLMAFDQDTNGAGSKAFFHWKETACKPVRWLPDAHDINEMKTSGMDIQAWADDGIETALLLTGNHDTEIAHYDTVFVTDNVTETITESVTDVASELVTENRESEPVQPASPLRYVPCHLSEYGLCSNQVIEQDESTWRLSPDGTLFCVECWQSRNIELASLAIPYFASYNQPTDIDARLAAWYAGPGCACCGSHEWVIDQDGFMLSPCVVRKRQENYLLDQERENEKRKQLQEWRAKSAA